MKSIGQLDQDDPDIIAQGEDHLSEVLSLDARTLIQDAFDLRQAINEIALFLSKEVLNVIQGDIGVLYGVMQ